MKKITIVLVVLLMSSCSDDDMFTGTASITLKTGSFRNIEGAQAGVALYFSEQDSESFKSWAQLSIGSGKDITLDIGKLNYGNYYVRYWTSSTYGSNSYRSQPFQVIAGEHEAVEIYL
jgi:hypothetical protein